jgi:hypothetical protein
MIRINNSELIPLTPAAQVEEAVFAGRNGGMRVAVKPVRSENHGGPNKFFPHRKTLSG